MDGPSRMDAGGLEHRVCVCVCESAIVNTYLKYLWTENYKRREMR